VHDDGTVDKRYVTTLRTIGDKWLIGEGLVGGETVIVEGTQRVVFTPGGSAPKVKTSQVTEN
jgi:membrane fusion protein (multidrug efflux system)